MPQSYKKRAPSILTAPTSLEMLKIFSISLIVFEITDNARERCDRCRRLGGAYVRNSDLESNIVAIRHKQCYTPLLWHHEP